jgi:hypothetical protein
VIIIPKAPEDIRKDVDTVFDQIDSYSDFGAFFTALIKANNLTYKGIFRNSGISRKTTKRWSEEGAMPEMKAALKLLETNTLNFRTQEDGTLDVRQRRLFLSKAELEMSDEERAAAIKNVLDIQAEYQEFHIFLKALYAANNRMSDDHMGKLIGRSGKCVAEIRCGSVPPSLDFIQAVLSPDINPFHLPVMQDEEGKTVVVPAVRQMFYKKAGLEEIVWKTHKAVMLERLKQDSYVHAGTFFKALFGHIPYAIVAARLQSIDTNLGDTYKFNSNRISYVFNGIRSIKPQEVDALLKLAEIAPESKEADIIKKLSYSAIKPASKFSEMLRTAMGDFNHSDYTFFDTSRVSDPKKDAPDVYKAPKGIQIGDLHARMCRASNPALDPCSYKTLGSILNGELLPTKRIMRYIVTVLDQGLDNEKVNELIKEAHYTREEIFQKPSDIVANISTYESIGAIMKSLRETEEINVNGARAAELLDVDQNHYIEIEKMRMTPDQVRLGLSKFNEQIQANNSDSLLLTEDERNVIIERAEAEYSARIKQGAEAMQGATKKTKYRSQSVTNRG